MPITFGQLPIDELSGPVSVYYLVPTETSKMEVPILFLGDIHFSLDGMCEPTTSSDHTVGLRLSVIEPLFYKILDSLGSKHGMIDFYLEHDSRPKWMDDLTNVKLPEQQNHSTITYLPSKHFPCFDKDLSETHCFTRYIRYHFVDVRNSDFTFQYPNVKKQTFTPKKLANNMYIDDYAKSDESFVEDEAKAQTLCETFRSNTLTKHLCVMYHLDVLSLINLCKANRQKVTNEYISNILTEYITYETALHRTLTFYFENPNHLTTFFGYQVTDIVLLLRVSPLDFIHLVFDFEDQYVQYYSKIYKQVRKLQTTNDLENYVNSSSQASYKLFVLTFCAYQYDYHYIVSGPSVKLLVDYLINKHIVYYHQYSQQQLHSMMIQLANNVITTLLCPILDLYFLMRSLKMYGYNDDKKNKPSILKVLHAGQFHVTNIVSFLVSKGYYKISFESSFDNKHTFIHQKHQPYLDAINTNVAFQDITNRFKQTTILPIWMDPDEIRLPYGEYQEQSLLSLMGSAVSAFSNMRCRRFEHIDSSIDSYISSMSSSKGLIGRRIRVFGIQRYLDILNGRVVSERELNERATKFNMTTDELMKYVQMQTNVSI